MPLTFEDAGLPTDAFEEMVDKATYGDMIPVGNFVKIGRPKYSRIKKAILATINAASTAYTRSPLVSNRSGPGAISCIWNPARIIDVALSPRDTQRKKDNDCAAYCCVIRCFGSNNAVHNAGSEFFRMFGCFLCIGIRHQVADIST